ncbi:MAG TPA: Lrp/AsnC family transcriptional regulator [Armatimonadota bacterium]|nr:Lrp/AsnC family transcriptional regulator [Armatimonadota bacterium]HOS43767.1 Lrp/AsnC family transcriptional regulator [Armatimonadota bacterium]
MLDILRMLEQDGRLTAEQLAERSGRHVDEVRRLVAEAEQAGIIRKYKAVINWERVEGGEQDTYAFIEVKVAPQRSVGFDAIAERIMRFPEVQSLYLLSGSYDLHVVVKGKDLRDVARFVSTKLSALDTVLSTTTHFVLRCYKVDGDILEDGEAPDRLPVSP